MKFAVIGLGLRAAHIVSDMMRVDPEAIFVAVADPNTHDPIESIISNAGAKPANRYSNAKEMLENEQVEFLIISSPNSMHLAHIESALETDIPHIFVEKPVVTTFEDSLALARLIRSYDADKRLMVGLVLRYSPLYRDLIKARDEGLLGDIMSIEASEHIAPYHGSFFMRDWRRNSEKSGGFLIEKCCHDLDLYQNLVGSRPARVASFGGRKKYLPSKKPNKRPEYYDVKVPIWDAVEDPYSDDSDIIDYQTALIEYQTGETLAFHTNIHTPDEFRRFCVIGTDGMAEGDFIRRYFKVTNADDSQAIVDQIEPANQDGLIGHYGADFQMVKDIFAYLAGESSGEVVPVRAALEAGVTAIACDIAMREKRVVELKDFWKDFDVALGLEVRGAA